MSEVRLVVREEAGDWSGTIQGSFADRAIAALSADPVTLEELEAALARFAKPIPKRRFLASLAPGLCAEPHDAGLVVIDLSARLVLVESTYSAPGPQGLVWYHDGHACTSTGLQYHLADDWLFLSDRSQWPTVAEARRRERAARPPADARAVFYGRPLLEHIARETWAAFARREAIASVVRAQWTENARQRLAHQANVAPDQVEASLLTHEAITPKTWPGQERYASLFYDTLKDIHAAWLLTPRADLGGACPREVALDRHDHIMADLHDRCGQWSLLNQCPPGLKMSSAAFRFGGFGTHELVKYYDLVRELLWSCWERLTELAQAPLGERGLEALTVGDFLTTEVPRLERVRDDWLDSPDLESRGRTPRSVIDHERARLPEGSSAHEAMVDPDCPCCQMMGDLPGPWFWHLDSSGMDDDFAFDIYHNTRAEWEEERRKWDEHHKRCEAERAERQRLGVTDPSAGADSSSSIWSRSISAGDTADVPLGIRVFGLGCHLAELICCLRGEVAREATPAAVQSLINELNRDFGNLREVLQSTDAAQVEALLDPVLDRFAETLATVAQARPDTVLLCEALTDEIRNLLAPPPPKPNWEISDPDVPF